MAVGGVATVFVLVDVLLRRVVLPLVLCAAVIFRFNLFSFVYLIFLLTFDLIPGPRLKSQRATSLVVLACLVGFSAIAAVSQALFQISIATNYDLEPCEGEESVWRQVGFVQFRGVNWVDVIRLLVPDVMVFVASLVTLCVNARITALHGRKKEEGGARHEDRPVGVTNPTREDPASTTPSPQGEADDELMDLSGGVVEPPFPSTVQCYVQVPKVVLYLLEFAIFIVMGLAGTAVPSLTSFPYYAVFLLLLIFWGLQLRPLALVRALNALLLLYSGLHLLLLDLFQFPSAQDSILTEESVFLNQSNVTVVTTTEKLTGRLFGLTPIIRTDCDQPWEFHLWQDLDYTTYLSPVLLCTLFWLLANDLRMWIFTPSSLWKTHGTYCLPVLDQQSSSHVYCVVRAGQWREQALWTRYGTMRTAEKRDSSVPTTATTDTGTRSTPTEVEMTETRLNGSPNDDHPVNEEGREVGGGGWGQRLRKKLTWSKVWKKMVQYGMFLWDSLFMKANFVFSIIAMMIWSVIFPSWPSLVLLLWACAIWLIPKFNPRLSLYYTSPLLVLYALCLLILQYIYSLDLTESELSTKESVQPDCHSNGCKFGELVLKTVLTMVFVASFRELISKVKRRWKRRQVRRAREGGADYSDEPGPAVDPTASHVSHTTNARNRLYTSLLKVTSAYWILVVVAAFLFVTLTGTPTLFKAVYMVFFVLFLVTYQVTRHLWFYLSFPVWCVLIVYAVLELILVYTYQFEEIQERWESACRDSSLTDDITCDELYRSIGLVKYRSRSVRSLIETLVPPAVFIAVMVMQLRYFKPEQSSFTLTDLTTLLPKFVQELRGEGEEEEERIEKALDASGEIGATASYQAFDSAPPASHPRKSIKRQRTISSSITPGTNLYKAYRLSQYLYFKARQLTVAFIRLFWRFLELHLHKIISLTLFVVAISQVSACYWILLVLLIVVVVPLPALNPLTYPLVTLYLGFLIGTKMVYQVPIIHSNWLEIDDNCTGELQRNVTGKIFHYRYSPLDGDSAWFGLHKADDYGQNFAEYVAGPIIAILLLSLWFSMRRSQTHHYNEQHIVIHPYERGSLFLNVPRAAAETSLFDAAKYLVNHVFEQYGVEVCWCMLAIAVAVRIDVYGVVYAVALCVLLFVPRGLLAPVWIGYLVIHGLLLLLQYSMLLALPAGACFAPGDDRDYWWSSWDDSNTALLKWFYLPDYEAILDKDLLYADFLVYLVVCFQLYYFHSNPVTKERNEEDGEEGTVGFLDGSVWLKYAKAFLFQYYFWVTLFLLFTTSIIRLSTSGFLYLLLTFFLLFRGQRMLTDRQTTRHRSWALVRSITWLVLFLRVSLQILDCVFHEYTGGEKRCVLILIFNSGCNKRSYYGAPAPDCASSSPSNIGLWVDAFNFIIITLQILIFDTSYCEVVRTKLQKRERSAGYFADEFDKKVELQHVEAQRQKEKELREIQERSDKLTETERKIDHLLYAGERIPPDVRLRKPRPKLSTAIPPLSEEPDISDLSETVSLAAADEEPRSKLKDVGSDEGEEGSKLAKVWIVVKRYALEIMVNGIEWLEGTSATYREVTQLLKEHRNGRDVEGTEHQPLARPTVSYGTTGDGDALQKEGLGEAGHLDSGLVSMEDSRVSQQQEVPVEIHTEAATKDEEEAGKGEGEEEEEEEQEGTPGRQTDLEISTIDERGGVLIDALGIPPTEEEEEQVKDFEHELEEKVKEYSELPKRFFIALYYAFLAHSEYLAYFLVILNVMLNGSVLSLVYAFLMFVWGLLSIPWPTRKFWLTMTFYTMLVIMIKYGFQFHEIEYWQDNYSEDEGLYPPRVLGIQYHSNFFANAVWDFLLLIALLFHRGLLRQSGLWRDTKTKGKESNLFLQTWYDIKRFVGRLLSPEISQGAKDYYVIMLSFDALCFVTIVFGFSSFGIGVQGQTVSTVASYIQDNYVPYTFVIMLILQFLSMMVDRAIYIRHSLSGKFVYYLILLVVWHVWLFFLLPSDFLTGVPFISNEAAQTIYFFKCCYFIVSSVQIVAGYPTRVLGYFLTSNYSFVSGLAFQVYRAIPLLPDLREVMDWMFTDTALTLLHWLRVQEIYAKVYLVKVRREKEKRSPRDLGDTQGWPIKILMGGGLLVVFLLLIWGPLVAISIINAASKSNPPVEVSIQVSLNSYEPVLELTAQQQPGWKMSRSEYGVFKRSFQDSVLYPVFDKEFERRDFTRVTFPGDSTSTWTISPPARELLIQDLENVRDFSNNSLTLHFSWEVVRSPESALASESVTGSNNQRLTNTSASDLATIEELIASINGSGNAVTLIDLFPRIVFAPSTGQSTNYSILSEYMDSDVDVNVTCSAFLNVTFLETKGLEWWNLSQDTTQIIGDGKDLELFIYSERVAPSLFGTIAGIGIIGLYVSVVLVVGKFIRGFISELPSQLVVDEIVNPDPILKLFGDIFLVRENKNFKMEEILVGKLFFIFRSPERLVKLTEDEKIKQE